MRRMTFLLALFICSPLLISNLIVFPPNHSFLKSKNVIIVAEAEEIYADPLPAKAFKTGQYYHVLISLKFGKNQIYLSIIKNGKETKENLILHYYPSDNYQLNGKTLQFHKSELSSLCFRCHIYDNFDKSCLNCHTEKKQEFPFKHKAFDSSDCSIWHENKTQMIVANCNDCHEREKGRLHAPYANNECVLCHDPHGSSQKSLLLDNVKELCSQCHSVKSYNEFNHPVQNHPMESKKIYCTSCHSAHGSPFPSFLKFSSELICKKCHE